MEFPHVVVFVPGIGGSVLRRRNGRRIWSGDPSGLVQGVRNLHGPGDADPISQLVLTGSGIKRADDDVVATEIVYGAGLLPGLAGVDFYRRFITDLRAGCGLVADRNYFEFPYDWRLDNRVNAEELRQRCLIWLRRYRETTGSRDARLFFVTHSMGGLVARYAVEVLGLWSDTRAVVTIGTPHRGSSKAALFLNSGLPGLGWYSRFTTLIRSLPSVHQLLPVYPVVRLGDGQVVRLNDPAVSHRLEATRMRDGARFLHEIADASRANQALDGHRAVGLAAVVGAYQPTIGGLTAEVARLPGGREAGDGTVTTAAAHPIEWDQPAAVMYAVGRHVSLAGMPAVRHHVIALMRGSITPGGLSQYRGADSAADRLILDCPDIVEADQPLTVVVDSSSYGDVEVAVVAVATERPIVGSPFRPDDAHRCVIPAPTPGCYRVSATVVGNPRSQVTDLVMVLPVMG